MQTVTVTLCGTTKTYTVTDDVAASLRSSSHELRRRGIDIRSISPVAAFNDIGHVLNRMSDDLDAARNEALWAAMR